MDGQNGRGFVPSENFDEDILNAQGWSAAGESHYSYSHHPQDHYSTYQGSLHQPAYDHFNVGQQPSYTNINYENSPYGHQFQRQADVFAQSSFSVDPPLQSLQNYQSQNRSYSFNSLQNENTTISPQNLQYSMNQAQDESNQGFKRTVTRLANGAAASFPQNSQENPYFHASRNAQYLQGDSFQHLKASNTAQRVEPNHHVRKFESINSSTSATPLVHNFALKSGEEFQNQPRLTRPDMYEAKNKSTRPRFEYAPFVVWEDIPLKITVGLKNTIPKYHPRRAKSGKELIPGFDVSKSLTPAQISTKKRGVRFSSKELISSANRYKGTSHKPRILTSKSNNLPEDGNSKTTDIVIESGSSETESSSDSESEYDEEIPIVDISEIRGTTRPSDPAQAARWDTIGLIWKDPNSNPNADSIKDAIEKYANFVSALRVKIKTNSNQLESSSRPGEQAKLQADRKELLESLYQTITTASELGYGPIVENLGGHHKLVNGLTTTLIECIKADDFGGKLPKAIFVLLAKFKTLTDELLKKLKFDSIQKRWNKKGDEEAKKTIAYILANTADARDRASKIKKEELDRKPREITDQGKAQLTETPASNYSNPSKRPHEGDASNSKPNKRVFSGPANSAAIAKSLVPKRGIGNLLGISPKPVKPPPRKREPSPPSESKLGALLASIAKDPEPPRAPEAPARAPETPEEKARRERKESRRHLRVKFKEGSELEEVRLFKHEQAEDEGRQDEMLRDAHDDRLEGMMHKRRVTEIIMEDDDDYQPSEAEPPYTKPSPINFSSLEKSSRFGLIYFTRGGDLKVTSVETKKQERREALELMVIYTDPDDIPYSPREPLSSETEGNPQHETQLKESSEPWLVRRLQEIQKLGPEQASQNFLNENQISIISCNTSTASPDLQHSGVNSQSLPQPPSQLMDPAAYSNLIFWVKYLSGKPYPATEPPEWMTPEAQIGWLDGYRKDHAIKDSQESRIAAPDQQVQMIIASQSTAFPSYQQNYSLAQPNFIQHAHQSIYSKPALEATQQVQNYLTAFKSGENQSSVPSLFDYNYWAAQAIKGHSESQSIAEGQDQAQRWEGDGSKDSTRGNQYDNSNLNSTQHNHEQQSLDSKPNYDSLFDENGEYKGRKKPCRFWADGKCAKGPKCTFLHT
ncbi:hypothetical protein K3495_g5861 [Podosphaera aphanis]|nr:hypothetical protein K3495_g5861 [Podosphaera aphanis]